MSVICPFISKLPIEEQKSWIVALNARLQGVEVVLDKDISPNLREQCTFAVVANPDPARVSEYPNILWLQSLWAGVERLVKSLDLTDIKLSRLIDPNLSNTMAEAVLAWTLYLHRDMPAYAQQQQQKLWRQHEVVPAIQCRVTVLGLGEMGKKSAEILVRHGFTVNGWSKSEKNIKGVNTYHGEKGLDRVIANTDILVCLLPQTPTTVNLINKALLDKLPPQSQVINFGRGPIVNSDELIDCLNSGQIKHAVLDVFRREPLPEDNILWSQPNVTILPHISSPTSRLSASKIVAGNIENYIKNNQLPECVDVSRGY